MKRYSVMLLPLTMMALSFLATGCVSRGTLKKYGDERYAQGLAVGASELKKQLSAARDSISRAEDQRSVALAGRDALQKKIDLFLTYPHTCKHKDLLR